MNQHEEWPALALGDWQPTYATLHMWLQIVGKTRLALAPMMNHWWQVALYVTADGIGTSPMPFGHRTLSVDFDFVRHELTIRTSTGNLHTMPLVARTVADFYDDFRAALASLGVEVPIVATPVEIPIAIPFADDREHRSYDPEAVNRWWRVLVQADRVLKTFAGRFAGKASPVHFFWGSFDLAYTRFSGRPAPRHPGGAPNCPDYVMVEAYSRECASFGFWPGGEGTTDAAFYAYAYPEPPGLAEQRVCPSDAGYHPTLHEFVLPYEAVRRSSDPDETLLSFLQSCYDSAADLGGWDRAALDRPILGARALSDNGGST